MVITLNDVEQRLAKYLARKRYEYCRSVKASATIYHEAGSLENEINAMGAELAYCRLKGVYPDLDYTHFPPFDAIVDGLKVDVKHTIRKNGRLLIKVLKEKESPDVFALMIGTFPEYQFMGEIGAEYVMLEKYIDRDLPYPAYAFPQEALYNGFPLLKGRQA